jgi:glycosyltransferase involved in cell wall biosynthesis
VLIVSRLVLPAAEQKGVLRVCEALSKVLAQVPEANCAIVGGGPAQPAIRARIEQLGLAGRIVLTGHLDDAELRWMYEHAAVLALPSTVEGFGLVYVEAMIRRVPVVAGRLDAAVDVVVDGVTGLLVNPLDVDAIAAALVTLLKDETLRAKMGAAGYDRVQEEFTYEAMARRLRKAFEELAP